MEISIDIDRSSALKMRAVNRVRIRSVITSQGKAWGDSLSKLSPSFRV